MVTIRVRDPAFKWVLERIQIDSEGKIDRPLCNLTPRNNAAPPAIPVASGMGITSLRSIVTDSATEKLPHRISLFCSNNRPEDAVSRDELQGTEHQHPNYNLFATMTGLEKSHRLRKAAASLIVFQMLDRHLNAIASRYSAGPIYDIAGPPQTIRDLPTMLINAGVDSDDIRIEEVSGY
jgi:ferredoxin-NADP reductase